MSSRTNKLVSLGLVTAGIVYGCYPYVSGAHPETPATETKLPRLTPRLLSPSLPPVGLTDPFRIAKPVAKTGPAPVPVQKPAVHTVKPAFNPTTALAGLALEATTIAGTRRFAMINGHVYAEGARVTQKSGDVPLVLARVEPSRVLLRAEGHQLELRYSLRSTAKAGKGTHRSRTRQADPNKPAAKKPTR